MAAHDMQTNAAAKIALYRTSSTYFIPTEYDSGTSKYKLLTTVPTAWDSETGTALGIDNILLPLEETATIKKVIEKWQPKAISGKIAASTTIVTSAEYKSKWLQRDFVSLEFDSVWAPYEGILIVVGHRFTHTAYAYQEYIAIFGQVQYDESEQDSKEGRPMFTFVGLQNKVAISIAAASDITPPVLSPAISLTIPQEGIITRKFIAIP